MNAPEPSPDGSPAVNDADVGRGRPFHMWIVGIIALLWYGAGVADYLLTITAQPAYLSQFTAEQLGYVAGFPAWVDIGWAFAVWGGLVGAVLLLLRSKRAVGVFAVSIVGMAATALWQFALVPDRPAEMMQPASLLVTGLLWVVAVGLLAYAIDMRRRGILR